MSYCIYLRKSRKDDDFENTVDGDTLARHRKILLEYAAKHRMPIAEIYEEIVSGDTIAARPVMQRLLEDVSAGIWSGVLVVEIERLARGDTMDQGLVAQTFKFSDTKIITPSKTYDPNNEFDEEYFEFGLFMSRREYKTINRRLQRGRMSSINEGKWVANKAPYGYKRYKLEGEKGFSLQPVEPQASIVRHIFELYTDEEKRIGCSKIARKLNNEGVQTMTGSKWTIATVRDMLRNPAYIGKVRWGRRAMEKRMENGKIVKIRSNHKYGDYLMTDGLHEAIVSNELFFKAQDYLDNNPPRPTSIKGTITNPLAGLVVCEFCGHHMQRRPYSRSYPASIVCNTLDCDCVGAQFELVEKRVLQVLEEWLAKYYAEIKSPKSKPLNSENNITKKLLQSAENELKQLEKQKAKIYDAFEKEIYNAEVFMQRSSENNEKIRAVIERINELKTRTETETSHRQKFALLVPHIEQLITNYDSMDTPSKNKLLNEVIEKITYRRTENGRWSGILDNFEIGVYPRIPR